jgi:hypothetical protein
MRAAGFFGTYFETLMNFSQATQSHIPEDDIPHING